MNKKIFGILVCCIFLASIYSSTAASINFLYNKESEKNIYTNNEDQPIQAIVEAEQIDGRSWKIKLWAYNQYDEDVIIRIGQHSANSHIYSEESNPNDPVFSRPQPRIRGVFIYSIILQIFPLLNYPNKKTIHANDKVLLDEYTFNGESNYPFWMRYFYGIKKICPEGNYFAYARIMYYYLGNLENAFSEDIPIYLEAP